MLRALLTAHSDALCVGCTFDRTHLFSSHMFGPALVCCAGPSELMSAMRSFRGPTISGMLLGPAISGILIAIIDAENVLFVNSATF